MNIIKSAIIALVTVSAMAASTATTTSTSTNSGSWFQQLKESPFSMSYLLEAGNKVKETLDTRSFDSYVYFGYKLNDTYSFRIVPSFGTDIQAKSQEDGFNQRYYSTQLRAYYNGILNKDDHGYSLNVHARYYIYNGRTQDEKGYDAKTRIYFTGSKKLNDKWSMSNLAFGELYDQNSAESDYVGNLYAGASFTYSFTDKFSGSVGAEYYVNLRENSANESEYISMSAGIGYELSWASLSAEFGLTPVDFRDQTIGVANDAIDDTTLTVSMYAPIF